MASINVHKQRPAEHTHEGAVASRITAEQRLRRSVCSCLLWENEAYEDGKTIAERIGELAAECSLNFVGILAVYAREKMKLRHVPLWLCVAMARRSPTDAALVLEKVIQRADEMGEFLALFQSSRPAGVAKRIPRSIKRAIGNAFRKFDAYGLAKFDKNSAAWSLRDVLRMCRPKPRNDEERELWRKVVKDELPTPDTWETQLSAGADKRETFTRLLNEGKLGALALLRNMRNMQEAGVDRELIRTGLRSCKVDRVLPFRFIAAARYAPGFEPELESAMFRCLEGEEKLAGRTAIVVDVSGSMDTALSQKSEMLRVDAASGLAVLVRELCDCAVYSFSNDLVEVPLRRGFALVDAIKNSQRHSGTRLGAALAAMPKDFDRVIVITDEQSHDTIPGDCRWPKSYIINVASNRSGIGYGSWTKIDGWSESVIGFIREKEGAQ